MIEKMIKILFQKLNRTVERENILVTHKEEQKRAGLIKLKAAVAEKERKILQLSNELVDRFI